MTWSLKVENISKKYQMGSVVNPATDSLYKIFHQKLVDYKDRIKNPELAQKKASERKPDTSHLVLSDSQLEGCQPGQFWALKNVSFQINKGERVGIVGKNGSGKSTLLKILSRITAPTEGRFLVNGRLVSLLEVGTGFHVDLSGRENIYLNAQINGMSKKAIDAVFDQIHEFSELGPQIDTPIKRYSSGMYMRLAFSVAAHIESDILIVDEVLAVGDSGFQKKCLDKMLSISNAGRTLIFVSHDMDAIRKICSSAIMLDHGKISTPQIDSLSISDSNTSTKNSNTPDESSNLRSSTEVTKEYAMKGNFFIPEKKWDIEKAPVYDKNIKLLRISILDKSDNLCTRFDINDDITVEIAFEVLTKKTPANLHLYIENLESQKIFASMDNLDFNQTEREPGQYVERCHIKAPLMNEGGFRANVAIYGGLENSVAISDNSTSFEVIDNNLPIGVRGNWQKLWPSSAVRPRLNWTIKHQPTSNK